MFCAFVPGFGLKIGGNLDEDLFFSSSSPNFGRKIGLEGRSFFCSAPDFGRKIGLNLSEDLFFLFFALYLFFGRKIEVNLSEDFFCSLPHFGRKIGLNWSGTISDSDLCSQII